MVDSLYKQYKLHANIAASPIAKVGCYVDMSGKATTGNFLPFPVKVERKELPMSKETALYFLELRSLGIIPPRVLGAFADIESQIEELARIN